MPFGKDFIKMSLKRIYDELNRFLTVILFILLAVTLFIKNFILDISKFLILALIIFRLFSKNKTQRNKENQIYLHITRGILKPFSNIIRNIKDRKTHVYKKCHKCKTTLKLPLPKKRGIQHAKCPACSNRLTIFTLRKKQAEKIKVEVIKKSRKANY